MLGNVTGLNMRILEVETQKQELFILSTENYDKIYHYHNWSHQTLSRYSSVQVFLKFRGFFFFLAEETLGMGIPSQLPVVDIW